MRWVAIVAVAVIVALVWWGRGSPPRRSRTTIAGEPSEAPRVRERGPPSPVAAAPPSEPPSSPAPIQDSLPASYFGDLTIDGIVHDEQGTRMAGMRVECVPAGIVPASEKGLLRFTVTSDADGCFRLATLPRAGRYAFHASGPGAYGDAVRTIGEVDGKAMEIEVASTVSYERYDLFDDKGQPIDVRGRLAFGVGDPIWTSGLGLGPETAARLAAVGVPLAGLPRNAAVTVFRRSKPTQVLGPGGLAVIPLTVRIDGYAAETVEPIRFRPSEWPRAVRVTLTPDDSRPSILYEVRFPSPPSSPPDIQPEIETLWRRVTFRVRIGEEPGERPLSRAQPLFWASEGTNFALSLWPSGIPVPYRVQQAGNGVEVTPDMPEIAVVALRFDPSTTPWAQVRDQEQVHFQIEQGGSVLVGRAWRPGLVLFDPLTPSPATLRCVWPEGGGFTAQARDLALKAGVCEIRWE